MSALDAFRAAFGDWGTCRDFAKIQMDAETRPLLCLSCKETNEDWYEYEEKDVGWKGLKCPACGVADNWEEA